MDSEQKTTRNWIIGAVALMLILLPMMLVGGKESAADLARAIQSSNLAETKRLLDNGVDPNARLTHSWWRNHNRPIIGYDPDDQLTPLILAAKNDRADMVLLLIDHHANLELRDANSEYTALDWAVASGSAHAERVLLDHGARLDAAGPLGNSPVMVAVATQNVEGLKMLVDRGAKLDMRPNQPGECSGDGEGKWRQRDDRLPTHAPAQIEFCLINRPSLFITLRPPHIAQSWNNPARRHRLSHVSFSVRRGTLCS